MPLESVECLQTNKKDKWGYFNWEGDVFANVYYIMQQSDSWFGKELNSHKSSSAWVVYCEYTEDNNIYENPFNCLHLKLKEHRME